MAVLSQPAGRRRSLGLPPARAAGLIVPIGTLILWQFAADRALVPDYFDAPTTIVAALWRMLASGELFVHAGASLWRAGAGFTIGSTLGILIGLAAGVNPKVQHFWEPLVSLTYPVPKIALLPIIFAWFGLGDTSKIAVISFSVAYPSYIAAFYGAKSVNRLHVWSARNMGAGRVRVFLKIVVPSALPQIFSGLRIGLGLSFIVMVAAELVTAQSGLGYLIGAAEDSQNYTIMYVAFVAIGAIGFTADRALLALRGRVLAGQTLELDRGRM